MALRGRSQSIGSSPDDLREGVMGKLGDTNMQRRGLSFGKIAHGEDAGKMDAEYRTINTSVALGNVYRVEHTLGHVPGFVNLWKSKNTLTPASHYSVIGWNESKWTSTTAWVRVEATKGSLDGGELTLMIGGE